MLDSQTCTSCGVEKNVDDFANRSDRPKGRIAKCRACSSRDAIAWRKANRERHNAYMREWTSKNRDRVNANARARRYGGADADEVLASQGGVCAICGTDEPGGRGHWAFDHNHECCAVGKNRRCGDCNRGILCNHCNLALGYFRDDPTRMAKAIEYLARFAH